MTSKRGGLGLGWILAFLLLGPCWAEGQSRDKDRAEDTAAAPANLPFAGVAGLSSVQFILDATKDSKTGTAAFGWRTGSSHFQFSFSGPLDDSGEATPLSLTGLPNGATVRIGYASLRSAAPSPIEQQYLLDVCDKHGLLVIVDATTPEDKKCRLENIPGQDQAVFAYVSHLEDPVWMLGGDLAVTRNKFGFRTPDTLVRDSESHASWSATGRIGRYSSSLGFVIASVTYKEAFSAAGPATEICVPYGDLDAEQCDAAVIGRPSRSDRFVASLEVRRFFKENFGITPALLYDFEKNVWAVDVPVYFLGDGTSALGGVRFGWRQDTKDFTAVVFVGAAVGLLPR